MKVPNWHSESSSYVSSRLVRLTFWIIWSDTYIYVRLQESYKLRLCDRKDVMVVEAAWACCLAQLTGRKRSGGNEMSGGIRREKALYMLYLSSTSHPRTSEPLAFDGKRKHSKTLMLKMSIWKRIKPMSVSSNRA